MSVEMKWTSFHVRATQRQAIAWNRAAEGEGHRSVGTWLAAAADAYLKVRARLGLPLPLAWRKGRSTVRLEGGMATVNGYTSTPFFAFRGTSAGYDRISNQYTLTLQSDGRIVATLATFAQCRTLAAELAPALLRGELPDPGAIVGRHVREAS